MKEAQNRSSQIIRTAAIGIAANVLLAAFKAFVGAVAGSVAIVMDAVNNLSDVLSSAITIVGVKLSQKPADREHPYGHGRIEYFSAIVIATIVLSAGVMSFVESAKKVLEPTAPTYTTVTLVVIIVAIVVKLLLGRYVRLKGEELKSDALIASGSDALFDAAITTSTLVSAAVMLVWDVSLDGILGVLISLAIIKAGVEMLSSPVNELLGAKVSDELVSNIRREVMSFEDVHGVYDLILHSYGSNVMIGSLHISVYDTLTAHDIHCLTRRISTRLYELYGIILTIGVYAIATGTNLRAELQNKVLNTISAHKEIVQVHGFYYSESDKLLSVDVVPDISVHDEDKLIDSLMSELRPLVPAHVQIQVVVDHNYTT